MREFQVGERVAVYQSGVRMITVVRSIMPPDALLVHENPGTGGLVVHPKQCRHLKPKKKKRKWFFSK